MVCNNQIERICLTILQRWQLSVNIHRYHGCRHMRLELHIQFIGVFILDFGGHHLPGVGDGLELDENVLTVGITRRDKQGTLIFGVAVGTDNEFIVAFRQVIHHKMPVGIRHARGHSLQRVVALHRDIGSCQVRAMPAIGVPCIFVGDIHQQRAHGIGDGGDAVWDAHTLAAFAVDGEVAGVANKCRGAVRRETNGNVCRVVDRQRRQRVTAHHRHPRHIRQRHGDVARRPRAVVVDLEIHYLALSASHRRSE